MMGWDFHGFFLMFFFSMLVANLVIGHLPTPLSPREELVLDERIVQPRTCGSIRWLWAWFEYTQEQ